MRDRVAPLYRSVNTRTHGVRHDRGGDARHARNAKGAKDADIAHASMHGSPRRGRDYTPLFRFLLSREGQPWDAVYAEAKARLDTTEPMFWQVALREEEGKRYVRTGESSYVSGLYVDREGLLRRVDPDLVAADMVPTCTCCTHTLDGIRFGKPGDGGELS